MLLVLREVSQETNDFETVQPYQTVNPRILWEKLVQVSGWQVQIGLEFGDFGT